MKLLESMKVKERDLKKDLMSKIQDAKARTSNVITRLRNIQDLTRLSNEVIAQLNDVAFKAIKQGGLQKMLDKRALKNE